MCMRRVNTHLIVIVRYAKYLLVSKRSIDSKSVVLSVRKCVHSFVYSRFLRSIREENASRTRETELESTDERVVSHPLISFLRRRHTHSNE